VASDNYRPMAQRFGLAFRSLASDAENRQLIEDPDFWHPLKGAVVGARWGVKLLPRHYDLFRDLAYDGDSVFVASPALLAARMVQEKFARPLATVLLQPWMIPSCTAPPVMPAGLTLPRWAPRPLGALYWTAINGVVAALMGKELWALRRRLGLAPVRRIFPWWFSPQLVIGMFPPWYGPPQPDWLGQIRLVGFPRFDGRPGGRLPDDLAGFCDAGAPPVAFTFGTGMLHAAGLFRAGIEACERLGVRGILLTRHARQLPGTLPPGVVHAEFAPFRELFPRCAAVVHHGGVGTIAEALAAGVPQMVLPVAYDQTDNAIRVERMGAGAWLNARRARGDRLADRLSRVMTNDARARCGIVAERFMGEEPLERAAQLVEELAGDRVTSAPAAAAQAART
jgi:UDP:flavonoid glycosyltransferase YjiC (YdhE family)